MDLPRNAFNNRIMGEQNGGHREVEFEEGFQSG
jgi:hypothetical protein